MQNSKGFKELGKSSKGTEDTNHIKTVERTSHTETRYPRFDQPEFKKFTSIEDLKKQAIRYTGFSKTLDDWVTQMEDSKKLFDELCHTSDGILAKENPQKYPNGIDSVVESRNKLMADNRVAAALKGERFDEKSEVLKLIPQGDQPVTLKDGRLAFEESQQRIERTYSKMIGELDKINQGPGTSNLLSKTLPKVEELVTSTNPIHGVEYKYYNRFTEAQVKAITARKEAIEKAEHNLKSGGMKSFQALTDDVFQGLKNTHIKTNPDKDVPVKELIREAEDQNLELYAYPSFPVIKGRVSQTQANLDKAFRELTRAEDVKNKSKWSQNPIGEMYSR